VYLERVELFGFKTFAARTALELRPGITAIVGPNGSGKSNIADAVRWALGETNLRAVRCRASDELIFAGGARRSSLGMAEVSLIFANDGGWLDLPFSEVRVTRRAYRSGEHEYLLNGTRVRLRDVVDLLAGASIHAGGHVVVGQGLVDAVLAMRAEERRVLVENLAGLKQYYLRREDAEGRLSATEANLVQVDGLIAELQPQVARLAQQAEALRHFREAETELRALQGAIYSSQGARLRARLTERVEAASKAEAALELGRRQAAEARAEEDRVQTEISVVLSGVEHGRVRVRELTATQSAAERDREVSAARLAAAVARQHDAGQEVERLTARVRDLQVIWSEAAAEEAQMRQALEVSAPPLQAAKEAHTRIAGERAEALKGHRLAESELDARLRTVSRLEGAVATAAAGIEGFSVELARQEAALQAAQAAFKAAEAAQAGASQGVAAATSLLKQEQAQELEARRTLETARREEAQTASGRQETQRRLDAITARRDALRDWGQQLEGYNESVRQVASMRITRCVVGQMLHIHQDWRSGVIAYLGALFEAVVTDDAASLLQAFGAGQLRGQVRALILDAEVPPPSTGDPDRIVAACGLRREDVAGWAAEVVAAVSQPQLVHALGLDRVLLLTTPDALLAARRALPALGLAAITRDALALLHDGTLVLGTAERAISMLQRRDDLAALETQLAEAASALQEVDQQFSVAQQAARLAATQHGALRRRVGDGESALARARDELRFQERVLARAGQDGDTAATACERARRELAARRARSGEDGQRLVAAREAAAAARTACEQARKVLESVEARMAGLAERVREEDRALEATRERVQRAASLAIERRRQLDGAASDLASRLEERDRATADVQGLDVQLAEATEREQRTALALAAASEDLAPLEQKRSQLEAHLAQTRELARRSGDRLHDLEKTHSVTRREVDAVSRDLDVLRAQAAAELRVALDDLPVTQPPPGAQARLRALRERITEIGPVNPRADVDYAAAAERQAFLADQAADLRSGVDRLRAIIAEANGAVRQRFATTVAELDQHFVAYFGRLFGGGSARLIACYDDNGLPSGMDMQVQPPGKRTRDLALLSGGERALVALSLLFAMLRVRPVPFCLLDEVEAALDEANTGRFGEILRELGAVTQMILITHNRGTMLHADHLIGVSMAETGVSTMVSMSLPQEAAVAGGSATAE
jgi:chromosome segregation protein